MFAYKNNREIKGHPKKKTVHKALKNCKIIFIFLAYSLHFYGTAFCVSLIVPKFGDSFFFFNPLRFSLNFSRIILTFGWIFFR